MLLNGEGGTLICDIKEEQRLRVFSHRVLREALGPKRE
jgi:hypothetical protein